MAEWWEWTGEPGPWQANEAPALDWGDFTRGGPGSWYGQETTDLANGPNDTGGGGGGGSGNWLQTVLGGLGNVGSFLGKNAGTLGPLLSGAGSIAGGAIGSDAANEAARLQAAALNRGIDLQTAQWLQQQGNLAPYLQAGQQGLSQLQGLAGREQPALPGGMASIDPRAYGMPGATPTWAPAQYRGPGAVQAGDYRWNPQQGPQAANFRYTPGAVPTLSGQELLANDPGVAFRLAEGRKALESSAAARGGLLSGPTLAALQRSGQELASQEYGSAWNRASQQAQLREQWNQMASQMGWSQAESEARFREQMAQQSQAQNWGQALQGQGQEWTQGFQTEQDRQRQQQQFDETYYNRLMGQRNQIIGLDQAQNETDYTRTQNAYKQQLAQHLLPWEQQSTLANLGGQAVGMYGNQGQSAANSIAALLGRQGEAEAMGPAGSALNWQRALTGAGNQIRPLLSGLNA